MKQSNMHDVPSYQGERRDILRNVRDAHRVLDVGCNHGAVTRALQRDHPRARVWGLEINPDALVKALPDLERGWCLDLDNTDELQYALNGLMFDHIIAGDVLEHTVRFQLITGILYRHLDPGGQIIVSVPNYGHWHTLWVFFSRKWPRNDRGIFDRTHRTIIMRRNLREFVAECPGGELRLLKRNFRFFETNRFWKLNMLITYGLFPLLLVPYVNDFFSLGYIFSIRKPHVRS